MEFWIKVLALIVGVLTIIEKVMGIHEKMKPKKKTHHQKRRKRKK